MDTGTDSGNSQVKVTIIYHVQTDGRCLHKQCLILGTTVNYNGCCSVLVVDWAQSTNQLTALGGIYELPPPDTWK